MKYAIVSDIHANPAAFEMVLADAKSQKADLVLIAGDLFDIGYASEQTLELIIREFERAPECKFVISANDHNLKRHTRLLTISYKYFNKVNSICQRARLTKDRMNVII